MIPEATEQARYEYPLDDKSVVFDVGAYHGQFALEMAKRYHCHVYAFEPIFHRECFDAAEGERGRIHVIPFGLSNRNRLAKFFIRGDSTGLHNKSDVYYYAPVLELSHVMAVLNIERINLLKLNCEGEEFNILSDLYHAGLMGCFDDIQVQFHLVENQDPAGQLYRYNSMKREVLEETHHLTYCTPWIWENWRRNGI